MKKLLVVAEFALNNEDEAYVHVTMLSWIEQYFMPDIN